VITERSFSSSSSDDEVATTGAGGSGGSGSSSESGSESGKEVARRQQACCCMFREDQLGELTWEKVHFEEKDALQQRRLVKRTFGRLGTPFSVCLSGGGVRAAAFEAGVLWRLASCGLLKDVQYLVSVSGGAYVGSGLVSHIVAKGDDFMAFEGGLDNFYLERVAEAILRMQSNISYLVREIGNKPFEVPKDGSSVLPRIFDFPILLIGLALTLLTFPFTFTVLALIPFTELVNLFFGAAARMAFCAPANEANWEALLKSSRLMIFLEIIAGVFITTFVVFTLWKRAPCCRKKPTPPGEPPPPNVAWLLGHGTLAGLTRVATAMVLCLLTVLVLTDLEIWAFDTRTGGKSRFLLCQEYITAQRALQRPLCSDFDGDAPWYDSPLFDKGSNPLRQPNRTIDTPDLNQNSLGFAVTILTLIRDGMAKISTSLSTATSLGLGMLVLLGIFLQPFFDGLVAKALFLVGPAVLFMISVGLVRWRVFSPVTGQSLRPLISEPFDSTHWWDFLFWTYLLAVLMVPFHEGLRGTMHRFYTYSLQCAFFAKGYDTTWRQVKANMLCPMLILTGTVNDYVRVDGERAIHEISLSPLHVGSQDLGYIRMRQPQSLAKSTALAGAATDAFILGLLSRIRYRFWLEILNLGMGDYIPFRRRDRPLIKAIKKRWQGTPYFVTRALYTFPSAVIALVFYSLMLVSPVLEPSLHERHLQQCQVLRNCSFSALALAASCFLFSFYGFLPCFRFLLHSPGVRQVHQFTRYYHRANRPPHLVYVTDGGVQDCTGVVQMIQRRERRILLALASDDPISELTVLRTTIEDVTKQRLASFFDPKSPTRDIRAALDEYQKDESATFLYLGIQYGWTAAEELGAADLIIVKSRLPSDMQDQQVQPLLTKADIMEGKGTSSKTLWSMKQTELGACCCDCCHTKGLNCAGRFPHYPNANQWITPQMFNALCRLGFELSKDAIEALQGLPA